MEKPHGKDAVVQAILEATLALVAEQGVHAVSFRDIASAANVNHGLITRHFGSKEELLNQVGHLLAQQLFHNVKNSGQPPLVALRRVHEESRIQVRALARLMLDRSSSPTSPNSNLELMDEVVKWFREVLPLDQRQGVDDNLIFFMIISLLIGSEIFGPHIQQVLNLDDDAYRELGPRAFEFLWTQLFQASLPGDVSL